MPKKIPATTKRRYNRLALSVRNVDQNLNITNAFKSVWVTNVLDGSNDYLGSDRIFTAMGNAMHGICGEIHKEPPLHDYSCL